VAEEPPSAPEVDDAPAPPSEAEAAPPVAPATEIPTSVDAAGFPETDLVGNLVAWHRGEGPSAQRIENRIVLATFEIEGVEPAARFQAPVGTAVPAQYVLRTLRRWLALPTADWTLAVDGRTLAPSETLGEVGVGDKLVIVVSM